MLEQIQITNLRNIKSASLSLHPHINLIVGANGSGKTSFLEAIHLLGLGRSFRSHLIKTVISHQADCVVVHGQLKKVTSAEAIPVGVSRSRNGETKIKIDGDMVVSLAQLAAQLPIQLINPDSYRLLTEGPKFRREFIDWGLFHVKHDFLALWHKFQRVLKQRNAALKQRLTKPEVELWNNDFVALSLALNDQRQTFIEKLEPLFTKLIGLVLPEYEISLRYARGWHCDNSLAQALVEHYRQDAYHGYTSIGPHRANLEFFADGTRAQDILSRGQQKLWASALRLAQGYLLQQETNKPCLYLLDDLPAELDETKQAALLSLLADLKGQIFVTCIHEAPLLKHFGQYPHAMFHVKHGCFDSNIIEAVDFAKLD